MAKMSLNDGPFPNNKPWGEAWHAARQSAHWKPNILQVWFWDSYGEKDRIGGPFEKYLARFDDWLAPEDGIPTYPEDLTAIIFDFFHLAQHVHAAGAEVFGDRTPPARDWAEQLLTTIRHHGFGAFEAMLEQSIAEHARSPAADAALTTLRQYVTQRRAMVDYPYFESQGWPIGSGPTESMAGILATRIKGRGRRWDPTHIDAVMALAALGVGDESQAYWQAQTPRPKNRRMKILPAKIVTPPYDTPAAALTALEQNPL